MPQWGGSSSARTGGASRGADPAFAPAAAVGGKRRHNRRVPQEARHAVLRCTSDQGQRSRHTSSEIRVPGGDGISVRSVGIGGISAFTYVRTRTLTSWRFTRGRPRDCARASGKRVRHSAPTGAARGLSESAERQPRRRERGDQGGGARGATKVAKQQESTQEAAKWASGARAGALSSGGGGTGGGKGGRTWGSGGRGSDEDEAMAACRSTSNGDSKLTRLKPQRRLGRRSATTGDTGYHVLNHPQTVRGDRNSASHQGGLHTHFNETATPKLTGGQTGKTGAEAYEVCHRRAAAATTALRAEVAAAAAARAIGFKLTRANPMQGGQIAT